MKHTTKKLLKNLQPMKYLLAGSILFAISFNTYAADYFVSISGNDNNNGSQASPWRTLSKACATVSADAGHVIKIGTGDFDINTQLNIPSGVSLVGEGTSNTNVNCKFFYNMVIADMANNCNGWNPSPSHFDPKPELSAAIKINGKDHVISGITFNGMSKQCIVGIFILKGTNLKFSNLAFKSFKVCAWWLHEGYTVELSNSDFLVNNSMGNTNQAYGAVMFHRADNLKIDRCNIQERGTNSYGIKMASKDQCCMWSCPDSWRTVAYNNNVEISNNRIEVEEGGTWNNGASPAITIEFNSDIETKNANIHHNWVNNHLSIVTWEKNMEANYHIHHNLADLRKDVGSGSRYAYFVEINEVNYEIDHNIVLEGYYPLAQWISNKTNENHLMHHNIFYAPHAPTTFSTFVFNQTGVKNMFYYNNTFIDTKGILKIFMGEDKVCASNTAFKNNIVYAVNNVGGQVGSDCMIPGGVEKNIFYNFGSKGSNNLNSNPQLQMSGDILSSAYFALKSNSPAIDAGIVLAGVTDGYLGSAPDMGAIEYGSTPWEAGVLPNIIAVTGISLSPATKSLYIDESVNLITTFSPTNATNKGLSFSSNKPTIASVDANGMVKALSNGTAIITATSADGNKTSTSTITVSTRVGQKIEAESYVDMSNILNKGTVTGGSDDGDWMKYSKVDFKNGYATIVTNLAVDLQYEKQIVEFRIDSPTGTLIGTLKPTYTGGWTTFVPQSTPALSSVTCVHDLYVVFKAVAPNTGGIGDFDWFFLTDAVAGSSSCIITGLNSSGISTGVSITPQPFDETATITMENGLIIESITVIAADGREVYSLSGISSSSIELRSGLKSGMYTVKLKSGQGVHVLKVLKR